MMIRLKTILPILAILGAVFLWGSSFSAMRALLMELPPFTVMFCRLFCASLFILPFSRRLWPKTYTPGDWKMLLPMVLFQPCLYFLFESNALTYTTSSQAGVISACLPVMVTSAAWVFLSESIQPRTLIGLFLAVTGVVVLTIFQAEITSAANPVLGNVMEFCAMICACGNIILIKKLSTRYDTWALTGMQVAAGLIWFLPGMGYFISNGMAALTWQMLLIIGYLGVCVSFFSFGLYNYGVGKVKASTAAIFINLIPVTAMILGRIFLNERLSLIQVLSAGAIIIGVGISSRPAQDKKL